MEKNNSITINDIAKLAGVGKSTVSRFLNEGYVSEENKKKIAKVIKETNYQSNFFARVLKSNRSKLIAIMVPRLDSYTAIETMKGMNEVLFEHGYQLIVLPKNNILEKEEEHLKRLLLQGYDAIVIMSTKITDSIKKIVRESSIPVVFVGQREEGVIYFTIDDYLVGSKIADYTNQIKGDTVLYLTVSREDQAVGIERLNGFKEHLNKSCKVLETGFDINEVCAVLDKTLVEPYPEIIVGATDNIALGAMKYLQERNIAIPDQVKIVGIGNYNVSSVVHPALTTLEIGYQDLGKNIVIYILTLLEKTLQYEKQKEISYQLVIRDSTK